MIKYVEKQHERYDKFDRRRENKLYRNADKAIKNFWKDPTEVNRGKAIDALQKEYENEMISELQHQRIDELTIDNYKDEKNLKYIKKESKDIKDMNKDEAAAKGLNQDDFKTGGRYPWGSSGKSKIGKDVDIAKYNSRISQSEYDKIQAKAHEKAVRAMYERYNERPEKEYKPEDLSKRNKRKVARTLAKVAIKSIVR